METKSEEIRKKRKLDKTVEALTGGVNQSSAPSTQFDTLVKGEISRDPPASIGKEPFQTDKESDMRGILFACECNRNGSYVIPSTKNFVTLPFTKLQLRICKFDPGASLSLFHFESVAQMISFITSIPDDTDNPAVSFRLLPGLSPGGKSHSLQLEFISTRPEVAFSRDIFPKSLGFQLDSLLFSLCNEDLLEILNESSPIHNRFNMLHKTLQKFYDRTGKYLKRREWSLIGNDIHGSYGILKAKKVYFICDTQHHALRSWSKLHYIENSFLRNDYIGPQSSESDELQNVVDEFLSVLQDPMFDKVGDEDY